MKKCAVKPNVKPINKAINEEERGKTNEMNLLKTNTRRIVVIPKDYKDFDNVEMNLIEILRDKEFTSIAISLTAYFFGICFEDCDMGYKAVIPQQREDELRTILDAHCKSYHVIIGYAYQYPFHDVETYNTFLIYFPAVLIPYIKEYCDSKFPVQWVRKNSITTIYNDEESK